jgi:hypothetical protein
MRPWFFIIIVVLAASAAQAGPPRSGTLRSTDLGGAVLTGNFSESWLTAGAHGQVGNAVNAMSWDGATLETQWKLWCPSVASPPVPAGDTRDLAGTGDVTYRTTYVDDQFWFSGAGPWGDNADDFTGTLENFSVTAVYHFVGGQLASIHSSVSTLGVFDGFPQCLEYTINSAVFTGTTDYTRKPGDYPDSLAADCASNVLDRGAWGTVQSIAMTILHCRVGFEPSAWGDVKRLCR